MKLWNFKFLKFWNCDTSKCWNFGLGNLIHELSFEDVQLGTVACELPLKLLERGMFRLGTFVRNLRVLSLGIFSLGRCCSKMNLRTVVWERSLRNFSSGTFTWCLGKPTESHDNGLKTTCALVNFNFRLFAWELSLDNNRSHVLS